MGRKKRVTFDESNLEENKKTIEELNPTKIDDDLTIYNRDPIDYDIDSELTKSSSSNEVNEEE